MQIEGVIRENFCIDGSTQGGCLKWADASILAENLFIGPIFA